MTVIDVHTHMLTLDWIELLKQHGGVYDVKPTKAGQNSIWQDGAPFMTLMPGMWDYDLRIKAMDKAKVDVAIVSLTCPNCFFGDRATSLTAARAADWGPVAIANHMHDRASYRYYWNLLQRARASGATLPEEAQSLFVARRS